MNPYIFLNKPNGDAIFFNSFERSNILFVETYGQEIKYWLDKSLKKEEIPQEYLDLFISHKFNENNNSKNSSLYHKNNNSKTIILNFIKPSDELLRWKLNKIIDIFGNKYRNIIIKLPIESVLNKDIRNDIVGENKRNKIILCFYYDENISVNLKREIYDLLENNNIFFEFHMGSISNNFDNPGIILTNKLADMGYRIPMYVTINMNNINIISGDLKKLLEINRYSDIFLELYDSFNLLSKNCINIEYLDSNVLRKFFTLIYNNSKLSEVYIHPFIEIIKCIKKFNENSCCSLDGIINLYFDHKGMVFTSLENALDDFRPIAKMYDIGDSVLFVESIIKNKHEISIKCNDCEYNKLCDKFCETKKRYIGLTAKDGNDINDVFQNHCQIYKYIIEMILWEIVSTAKSNLNNVALK